MAEGQFRELSVGPRDEDKILISKQDGKLYGIGAFCSHFGVPLNYGDSVGDKIMCAAHGATFNSRTGEIETAPALDNLPTYEIVEEDGKFFALVPETLLQK